MNKSLELAKISAKIALVFAIMGSAFYVSHSLTIASTFQLLDGRESVADSIFRNNLHFLKTAYTLILVAFIFVVGSLYFSYKGYRDKK